MQTLVVDCAHGVGASHLQTLTQPLQMSGLHLTAKCTGDGILNGGCGADYIQKERAMPDTFETVPDGSRCVCTSVRLHTQHCSRAGLHTTLWHAEVQSFAHRHS